MTGFDEALSITVKFQQGYQNSHRIFRNLLLLKNFRRFCSSRNWRLFNPPILGAAEPRYVLQSPGLVENCVGLYVPLLEFNHGCREEHFRVLSHLSNTIQFASGTRTNGRHSTHLRSKSDCLLGWRHRLIS
jgi:hypothetical protein